MAGVLLHEGSAKGLAPTIEVLSFGATTSTRRSEDLLPYLPGFRQFYTRLPKTPAEMSIKSIKVSLLDVECLTKTLAKVISPVWDLDVRNSIDVQCRSISVTY